MLKFHEYPTTVADNNSRLDIDSTYNEDNEHLKGLNENDYNHGWCINISDTQSIIYGSYWLMYCFRRAFCEHNRGSEDIIILTLAETTYGDRADSALQ